MRRFLVILAVQVLVIGIAALAAAGPAPKVDVCHWDADAGTFLMINISENAFQAHVDHGDGSPGSLVPGIPGFRFATGSCEIEQWQVLDTILVPSNGNTVASAMTLSTGVAYELRATGTYVFVNWAGAGIADAQCSLRITGHVPPGYPTGSPQWVNGADLGWYGLWAVNYLEVWVNGSAFGWTPTTCQSSHVYTGPITGAGTQLTFRIPDDHYGDNSGSITVEIWGWA